MEDSGEFGRVWGKINILQVKVWSLEATKQTHRRAKLAVFAGVLRDLKNGVRKRGLSFLWSQRTEDSRKKRTFRHL